VDKIFKALADINRRKILTLLKTRDMSVSELLKYFEIGQATLSSHLAILRKTNLVNVKKNERLRIYSLNKNVFTKFVLEINKFAEMAILNDEIIMRR
jgi:ArsR family transcriptional regulator, arsenate/arsenite/antimonite-responsive transcriptional repressor